MKQYIYYLEASLDISYSTAVNIERSDGAQFEVIDTFIAVITNFFLLQKRFGFSRELLKLVIKLITKRNALYIVKFKNTIASEGLISFGQCNHYPIAEDDCVIGPVNTNQSFSGKGFATFGLINCILYLKHKQLYSRIYIDTKEDNYAMQKVIEKSAFGDVKSSYLRNSG